MHLPFSRLALICLLLCLTVLAVTGCSLMPQATLLEGTEKDQAIANAEPIADHLFDAMLAKDYAAFSRDFDEAMQKAMDEKSFNAMVNTFAERIGPYQSREVQKVEQVENLVVITYLGRFEKEEAVSIRLTIRPGDPTQVAGLWFDSPKLREK